MQITLNIYFKLDRFRASFNDFLFADTDSAKSVQLLICKLVRSPPVPVSRVTPRAGSISGNHDKCELYTLC